MKVSYVILRRKVIIIGPWHRTEHWRVVGKKSRDRNKAVGQSCPIHLRGGGPLFVFSIVHLVYDLHARNLHAQHGLAAD